MLPFDQHAVARARDRFFDGAEVPSWVRPQILRSWRRCARLGINPGSSIEPKFVPETRSRALRNAAEPVVQRLLRHVGDDRAAMLLLNGDGVVVERWSRSSKINRILDATHVTSGRLFDEESAGTTGLGTPLEDRRPAVVEGAEHVLTGLERLTAVGVPIVNPARGALAGIVDVVAEVGTDARLLQPLIVQAAREIGDRLVAGYAAADRMLLDAFLVADRRGPKRPILAVNGRILIGNVPGNLLGLSRDHDRLWQAVRGALSDGETFFPLEGGHGGRIRAHVVPAGPRESDGALVHLEWPSRDDAPRLVPGLGARESGSGRTARQPDERENIVEALDRAGGNRRAAAEALGISRATLYRKLARLGI